MRASTRREYPLNLQISLETLPPPESLKRDLGDELVLRRLARGAELGQAFNLIKAPCGLHLLSGLPGGEWAWLLSRRRETLYP